MSPRPNGVSPLSKRLLVVTGKGGVGKSTISAGLGVVAASRGLSTIVAEVAERTDVARLFGVEPGEPLQEIELMPRLHHVSINRREATEEYLREETRGPLPAAILSRSRAFELFVAATPGLAELLTIGKAFELTRRPRRMTHGVMYDLVILDGPASGHASALLQAPRTFAGVARVGPVAKQAREIDETLCDHKHTGVVLVTTGEQMAVSETLELRSALSKLGMSVDAVIENEAMGQRLNAKELARLANAPAKDPAIRSAFWLHERAGSQRSHLRSLRRSLGSEDRVTLPFLFTPEIGVKELEGLAGMLRRGLDERRGADEHR